MKFDGVQLRCPNDRPHGKYKVCGCWMGGVDNSKPSTSIIRCGNCGSVYKVTVDDMSHISFNKVYGKIDMDTKWRKVNNERE